MLQIKPISRIPKRIASAYLTEANAVDDVIFWANKKFGIFDGEKLVGFTCAIQKKGETIRTAIYIEPPYRGNGAAKRLAYRVLAEAKKAGHEGMTIMDMNANSRALFEKQKQRWEKLGSKSPFSEFKTVIGPGGILNGKIKFKRPRKLK
jgi:GNAT superfamily N-acetyltransferase